MTQDTADGTDETNRTTYHVPITAHGGVYVVADDVDEAIDEALNHTDAGELEKSRDIQPERVREGEPGYGTPANVDDSTAGDDRAFGVPSVPTVQDLRRTRNALDLTRPEVSRYLDVTASGLGKWEREETAISLEQTRRYAAVLSRLQRDEEVVLDAVNGGVE